MGYLRAILLVVGLATMSGCASYYQRNLAFQRQFTAGQMDAALAELESNKKAPTRPARFLHYCDKGVVLSMMGKYEESIAAFAEARRYVEDHRMNIGMEALAFLANPNISDYTPEDFESVLVYYYQARNYIDKGDFEGALVEIRAMNERLQYILDVRKKMITYKKDAFALNMMGMVYEASGDINNAFIAYRNAHNAYTEVYVDAYNTKVPQQLKLDILRTAAKMGFTDELSHFERVFNMQYQKPAANDNGTLVFLWHNGLGPVKAEWALTFTMIPGVGGAVTFKNEELGLVIPFSAAEVRKQGDAKLTDTRVIRIAVPKFVERVPLYKQANLLVDGKLHPLDMAEDVNAIAIQDLRDHLLREVGIALLRVAMKQATAELVRKENEGVGLALDILGAVTEHADTRNWQTLPHDIQYVRLSLPPGEHKIELQTLGLGGSNAQHPLTVNIEKGRTSFVTFSTLESVTQPLEGIWGDQ